MPAILPGYTYDIFISYRQKDNKYDGWVTEFVDNLLHELESTFKENVNVYFDINPYEGLMETHDVNDSLREKLKCLVFIPIISRTYCDPNSFAWVHEFKAFLEQAAQDRFGLKIKLPGGNVASRILPVKIHDIDPEDKTMLEGEMGGVLRSLDFIYKSAGVNRPLKPDDSRIENLNHTYYRDQINKVANSVKEIITGLKNFNIPVNELLLEKISSTRDNKVPKTKKLNRKLVIWSIILIGLFLTGYFILPALFNTSSEPIEKSIAVLPFENLSNDPEQQYFSDGMMEEILNHLYKIGELRIIPRTSSMNYRETSKPIRQIALELDVNFILEGSVRKSGNRLRIQTKLINAKNEQQVIWSEVFDRETSIDNILDIQSEVAQNVAYNLNTNINPEVRKSIQNHATQNKMAYDLYLKGLQYASLFWEFDSIKHVNNAMQYLLRAIEIDPQFSLAYTRLGECYWILAHFSPNSSVSQWLESERALKKAIDLDPNNGLAYANYAVVQHNWKWERDGAEKSLEKAIKLMPANHEVRNHAFVYYIRTGQCEKALAQKNALNQKKLRSDENAWILLCQGKVNSQTDYAHKLHKIGSESNYDLVNLYLIEKQYNKAMELANKCFQEEEAFKLLYLACFGVGAALSGESDKALNTINQFQKMSDFMHIPDYFFAMIYFALGNENVCYAYLEKSLANHEFWIHSLKDVAPFYDHRDDPKIRAIIERSWIPLAMAPE